MKSFLIKTLELVLLGLVLAIGAAGQSDNQKKRKIPPKEGKPPVVTPKEKPPVKRPGATPKPEYAVAKGFMKAPRPE